MSACLPLLETLPGVYVQTGGMSHGPGVGGGVHSPYSVGEKEGKAGTGLNPIGLGTGALLITLSLQRSWYRGRGQ